MEINGQDVLLKKNPLETEKIGKLLMSYSIPAILAIIINAVYNIADQIFIGQSVGYLGNAATTIIFPLLTVVMAIASLLGTGATTYSAVELGKGNKAESEKALNNVFLFTLLIGIVFSIVCFIGIEPLLRLSGADSDTMPLAKNYGGIIVLGIPFNMLSMALSGLARVDGNPRISMYGMLAGAILNVILDMIYLFVFQWGVQGAALATITSQFVSACIMFCYFTKKSRIMKIRRESLRFNSRLCREIIKLGASAGISQFAAFIMQLVMNNTLQYYGNQSGITGGVAIAAMGVVMKILMVLAAISMGLGIGAQPILGFNYGAKNNKRVKETYLKACLYATIFISIGWFVCQLAPSTVIKLFESKKLEFINFATKCVRIYLGGIFLVGFEIISTNYFQATKQPLKASVLSLLRQFIILIPLLLLLPTFMGIEGVLYAGLIADILSGIIIAIFIIPEMRRISM
ncbi:MAG: MATE family efflux transporter [Oscillospiraceae bacterium]